MHRVNAMLFKILHYAAVFFNAILSRFKSSVSDSCTSNALISGRIMILRMQRFTIMVSLVGYFVGHVDAQFYYPLGNCLNAANGGANLVCTAKEVTANVTGIEGPLTCIQGTTVKINATLRMDLNAARFDLGVYVGINGTDAKTGGANCLVQSLGPEDAARSINTPRVYIGDGDICWDSDPGLVTIIHKNIDVLCTASATIPGSVSYNTCFVWKPSGSNTNCNISNVLLPDPNSVSSL